MSLENILLTYLKNTLDAPTLNYATAPVRLQGGFETAVYRFQLEGIEGIWSRPLILRLYPQRYGTRNAIWESTVQNTLADAGYPVPKAHLVCTDMALLGGAFFIMDCVVGTPLIAAPKTTIPQLLGQTHAHLHQIDPSSLVTALQTQQIDQHNYTLASRFDRLARKGKEYAHLAPAVDWLLANRPPEPPQLAICHGDFHPLNILIDQGHVSGVIDWPGFVIADPAVDVAAALILAAIPPKYLAPALGLDFTADDVDPFVQGYLAAYETVRPLDRTNLPYYQVFRAVKALIEGADGQASWQHPGITQELKALIYEVTGVQVYIP